MLVVGRQLVNRNSWHASSCCCCAELSTAEQVPGLCAPLLHALAFKLVPARSAKPCSMQIVQAPDCGDSVGGLSIAQRAAGAIIGCCVADAAATPVQWIYDVAKLQQLLQQRQQVSGAWFTCTSSEAKEAQVGIRKHQWSKPTDKQRRPSSCNYAGLAEDVRQPVWCTFTTPSQLPAWHAACQTQRAPAAAALCCISFILSLLPQATNGTPAAAADSVGLEFFDPVQSSFLPMYTTGRNSPYGEQTLLLLRSLAEQAGLHCGRYAELYGASYSSGFDGYMNASTVVSACAERIHRCVG